MGLSLVRDTNIRVLALLPRLSKNLDAPSSLGSGEGV